MSWSAKRKTCPLVNYLVLHYRASASSLVSKGPDPFKQRFFVLDPSRPVIRGAKSQIMVPVRAIVSSLDDIQLQLLDGDVQKDPQQHQTVLALSACSTTQAEAIVDR
jgi:hypothetical protein